MSNNRGILINLVLAYCLELHTGVKSLTYQHVLQVVAISSQT